MFFAHSIKSSPIHFTQYDREYLLTLLLFLFAFRNEIDLIVVLSYCALGLKGID